MHKAGSVGKDPARPSFCFLLASVAATVPAVFGVVVGKRVRERVGDRERRRAVLGLLTVGVTLLLGGAGLL